MITDHSAVKAVLETPNPSGKHARWWLKVFGSGVKNLEIKYRPGKDNTKADSLSRNPVLLADQDNEDNDAMESHVARVHGEPGLQISELLETVSTPEMTDYHREQQKDEGLRILYNYLVNDSVPHDEQQAKKICAKAVNFAVLNDIVYFIGPKHQGKRRAAVPTHLQEEILRENHGGIMAALNSFYQIGIPIFWPL